MLNLVKKAHLRVSLSPEERALLRFAEVLLVGAVLSGLQAIIPVLSGTPFEKIAWDGVLHTFLAAFVMALFLGLSKYLKAFGDPPLKYDLGE